MNSNLVHVHRCGGSPAAHAHQEDAFSHLGARHNLVLTQIAEAESTLKAESKNALWELLSSKTTQLQGPNEAENGKLASVQSEQDVLTAKLQREQEEELVKMRREHSYAMEQRKKEAATRIAIMRSGFLQMRENVELEHLKQQRDIETENESKLAELAVKREAVEATAAKEYLALLGRMASPGPVQQPAAAASSLAVDDHGSCQSKKFKEPIGAIAGETDHGGEQERQASQSVSKSVPMGISSTPSQSPKANPFPQLAMNGSVGGANNRKRKTPANTARDLLGLSPDIIIVDHPNKRVSVAIKRSQGRVSSPYFVSNEDNEFVDVASLPLPPSTKKPKVTTQYDSTPNMTPSPEPQHRRAIILSEPSSPDIPLAISSQQRRAVARTKPSTPDTPPVALSQRRKPNAPSGSSPSIRPRTSMGQRQTIDLTESMSPDGPIPAMGHSSWNDPGGPRPGFVTQSSVAPHLFGQSGQMRSFEVLRIRFDRLNSLDEELWGLNTSQTFQLHLIGNAFLPRAAGQPEKWHLPEWTIVPANVTFVRFSNQKARLRLFRKNAGDSRGYLWIDFANMAVLDGFLAQFRPMFLMRQGNVMHDPELSFYPPQ